MSELPPLWGDGIHDDTDAIQAWFDAGAPLPEGTFMVRRTVRG